MAFLVLFIEMPVVGSKVLKIVIKFEGGEKELRERERELNNWLMEQGW